VPDVAGIQKISNYPDQVSKPATSSISSLQNYFDLLLVTNLMQQFLVLLKDVAIQSTSRALPVPWLKMEIGDVNLSQPFLHHQHSFCRPQLWHAEHTFG
jgi:hypothetical protein